MILRVSGLRRCLGCTPGARVPARYGLGNPQNLKSCPAGPPTPPVEFVRELSVTDSPVHASATKVITHVDVSESGQSLKLIECVCCVCSSGHLIIDPCGKRWIVVLLGGRYGQLSRINCLLTDD
jgi:hypothetical protein